MWCEVHSFHDLQHIPGESTKTSFPDKIWKLQQQLLAHNVFYHCLMANNDTGLLQRHVSDDIIGNHLWTKLCIARVNDVPYPQTMWPSAPTLTLYPAVCCAKWLRKWCSCAPGPFCDISSKRSKCLWDWEHICLFGHNGGNMLVCSAVTTWKGFVHLLHIRWNETSRWNCWKIWTDLRTLAPGWRLELLMWHLYWY